MRKIVHKQPGGVVQVGDAVMRNPVTFREADPRGHGGYPPMRGVVAYVHPKGRYHMVAFETDGGVRRECFAGITD